MNQKIINIGVDGDVEMSPADLKKALQVFAKKHPDVGVMLLTCERKKYGKLPKSAFFFNTDRKLKNADDAKTSFRERTLEETSLGRGMELVKAGTIQAVISGGDTGALAVTALTELRIRGVKPALAAFTPGNNGKTLLTDVGAKQGQVLDSQTYLKYAKSAITALKCLGVERPKIGILGVGEEEYKLTEHLEDVKEHLEEEFVQKLQICPQVHIAEGYHLAQGDFDLILTDGHTGNVAIKAMESTGKFIKDDIRAAAMRGILSKLAAHILFNKDLKNRLNPDNYNGAFFTGLNGLVIKSHGGGLFYRACRCYGTRFKFGT